MCIGILLNNFDQHIQHTQVVQSPIYNDCLKVSIYCHSETQLVPKHLHQVSARELRNSMVGPLEEGGLIDARYDNNNIVIIDSTLRNILPPQPHNMSA